MICLSSLTIIISLYIMLESHDALANLPPGFRPHFLCKAKYLSATGAASAYLWYAATSEDMTTHWLLFISAVAIAWFICPRTVYRFGGMIEVKRGRPPHV